MHKFAFLKLFRYFTRTICILKHSGEPDVSAMPDRCWNKLGISVLLECSRNYHSIISKVGISQKNNCMM